jgi:hypothetical protein
VDWKQAAEKLKQCNSELLEAMQKSSPTKQCKLIYARYPFGSNIIKNGVFQLPNGKKLQSFERSGADIKNLLNYNWKSIPLGIVISGAAESFWISEEGNMIPQGILKPGATCAKRTIFDESYYNFRSIWNLNSGARTLFILPSIKDKESHSRLTRKYCLRNMVPKNVFKQHEVFSALSSRDENEKPWFSEFLFFTREWIAGIQNEKYNALSHYLKNSIWRDTEFERNEAVFDFVWHQFIQNAKREGFKLKSYIYHFTKTIVKVALGEAIALAPVNDDALAPINDLSEQYVNVYKLKQEPIFMCPKFLNWELDEDTVYLSLQVPIHANEVPVNRTSNSGLDDISDIEKLLELFYNEIESNKNFILQDSKLVELPKKISFEFYHKNRGAYQRILPSSDVPKSDNRFQAVEKFHNAPFPEGSVFFNGCIKVRYQRR